MSFRADLATLSILAEIASTKGYGVRTKVDDLEGECGQIRFGIDAGGAYIKLYDQTLTEDDAKTLIANLLNALEQLSFMTYQQEDRNIRRQNND